MKEKDMLNFQLNPNKSFSMSAESNVIKILTFWKSSKCRKTIYSVEDHECPSWNVNPNMLFFVIVVTVHFNFQEFPFLGLFQFCVVCRFCCFKQFIFLWNFYVNWVKEKNINLCCSLKFIFSFHYFTFGSHKVTSQ